MDEQEYRAKISTSDAASLDKRVKRWKQLVPSTFDVTLPNLVWYYLTEADEMFIGGRFIGVVLLSAAIVELVLADQLRSRMKMTFNEVERSGFAQMVIMSVDRQR